MNVSLETIKILRDLHGKAIFENKKEMIVPTQLISTLLREISKPNL